VTARFWDSTACENHVRVDIGVSRRVPTATYFRPNLLEIHMSRTSIPVDQSTKDRLDNLKRDDETWDQFLHRVTSDEEPIEAGAWTDEEAAQAMESIRQSRENWG
jgi:hypothetical protein